MIKVFRYIDELDCFNVTPEFKRIAGCLGITEWSEVVWIGRYFSLDNDYGEHWFDNWGDRTATEQKSEALGYEPDFLLLINRERLRNGEDGPYHSDGDIKRFWTDVLKSLPLSLDTIFAEARNFNQESLERKSNDYLPDLKRRIATIKSEFETTAMSKFSDFNFKGKKALIRVDFNVPIDEGYNITDDTRMRAAVPTIKKILGAGGSVVLMSHLGRPKEGPTEKYSLKHLLKHLGELLGIEVQFANDSIGNEAAQKAQALQPGQVLLLENLRFYKEEEKGDKDYAEKLAKLGDVYINDAFGTAHRAHASTAVIADYFAPENKMFGLVMEGEVASAEKVLHSSEKPFTAIIGGAKVSDKIMIIENLLERATDVIIGGGMAYTFYKAMGGRVGKSLVEEDRLQTAEDLMKKAEEKGVCIHLPSDSIIADKFAEDANVSSSLSTNIPEGWMGLDIGAMACEMFTKVIRNSKVILWNGPMGVFEMEKFQHGTKGIAKAVAEATEKGAFSLVGGGDSVAAVNQFGYTDKVSYVSTGGGAMLEYFEGKELPGIAAVK